MIKQTAFVLAFGRVSLRSCSSSPGCFRSFLLFLALGRSSVVSGVGFVINDLCRLLHPPWRKSPDEKAPAGAQHLRESS